MQRPAIRSTTAQSANMAGFWKATRETRLEPKVSRVGWSQCPTRTSVQSSRASNGPSSSWEFSSLQCQSSKFLTGRVSQQNRGRKGIVRLTVDIMTAIWQGPGICSKGRVNRSQHGGVRESSERGAHLRHKVYGHCLIHR